MIARGIDRTSQRTSRITWCGRCLVPSMAVGWSLPLRRTVSSSAAGHPTTTACSSSLVGNAKMIRRQLW